MHLPEQRKPTHTLRIDVPLNVLAVDAEQLSHDMGQAMQVIMGLTQLGTRGILCDTVQVSMIEADA